MRKMQEDTAASERRMEELEKEYAEKHLDPENLKRLDELWAQISDLLGKNKQFLFREYSDRLIGQYNIDPDWFYRKGLEDARKE